MDLEEYSLDFKPGWDEHFKGFDKESRKRIVAKLKQMKQPLQGRGLHSSRYLVKEVGGYRIAYICDEANKTKHIHFVGNHKQYEKWCSCL